MAVAQRGFTLVELLVALALAGLMYALVPPMFGAGMAGTELKSAARQVAAGLRKARGEAIHRHRESTLAVDVEAKSFRIGEAGKTESLPKRLDIKVLTADNEVRERVAAIRFYPDGSSTGGRVTLAAGERKFMVDVDWLTGRVTITD